MFRVIVMAMCVSVLGFSPVWGQGEEEMSPSPFFLDVPSAGGHYSGVGTVHGWICKPAGDLTIRFNDREPLSLLYGAQRADVLNAEACDSAAVGFVTVWNWGELGDGEHTATVYDGEEMLTEVTFTVATLGEAYVPDAEGSCMIEDFPAMGETASFTWSTATQHLELDRMEMAEEDAMQ